MMIESHFTPGWYSKRVIPNQAARRLELRRREHYQALSQSSLAASCARAVAAAGARRGPSLSESLSVPPASLYQATLAPLAPALVSTSMPS